MPHPPRLAALCKRTLTPSIRELAEVGGVVEEIVLQPLDWLRAARWRSVLLLQLGWTLGRGRRRLVGAALVVAITKVLDLCAQAKT